MLVSKTLRLAKRLFRIFLRDLKTETICTLNDWFLWRNCKLMSCRQYYQVKGREVQIVIEPKGYTILHYICGNYDYKGRSAYCRYDQLLAPFVNRNHYY